MLLIAGIAYALTRGDDDPGSEASGAPAAAGKKTQQDTPRTTPASTTPETTTEPTTEPTTPAGVVVDPADYIGMKSKDAEHQLKDLGFIVEKEETAGGEKDIVADITPSGTLQEGETVTLLIYTGDESGHGPGGPGGPGDEHGHGDKPPKPGEED